MKTIFRILHGLYRGVLYLLTVYLVAAFAVMIILHSPAVQERIVPWVEQGVSKALKTRVEIGSVHVKLFDVVQVTDFTMYDQQDVPMFRADDLRVGIINFTILDWLRGKSHPKRIGARTVTLKNGLANLYVAKADSTLNLNFLIESEEDSTLGPIVGLRFPQIDLQSVDFNFVDSTLTDSALAVDSFRLNYGNLHLQDIDLNAGFSLNTLGHMKADLKHLQAVEPNAGVNLRHLSVNFKAFTDSVDWQAIPEREHGVQFNNLALDLNRTKLQLSLNMRSEFLSTLFLPNRNRKFSLRAKSSVLDPKLISLFAPLELPELDMLGLEGDLYGDYKTLASRRLQLSYGKASRVDLRKLIVTDYTQPKKLFARVDLAPSYVLMKDLNPFLPNDTLRRQLAAVHHAKLEGIATGDLGDVVTRMDVRTNAGDVRADVKLFNIDDLDSIKYKGDLQAIGINLDTVLNTKITDRLNTELSFVGKGIDPKTMRAEFQLKLYPSRLAGYEIDSARGDLEFKRGEILGNLTVSDEEGSFDGNIDVVLTDTLKSYQAFGDLQRLDLHHYGVTEDTLKLSTILNLKMEGDSLDDLTGYLRVFETNLYRFASADSISDTLTIRQLKLKASQPAPGKKQYNLTSNLVDAEIAGAIQYKEAAAQVSQFVTEVQLYLQNDTAKIDSYYTAKAHPDVDTRFSTHVDFKDLSPIMAFFGVDVFISPGSLVNIAFHFGESEDFEMNLAIDTMSAFGVEIDTLIGRYELHKPGMRNSFLGDGDFHTQYLKLADGLSFTFMNLVPVFEDDVVDFTLEADQNRFQNRLAFDGQVKFRDDGLIQTELDANKTELTLEGQSWRFSPKNRVMFAPNVLLISNFALYNASQRLSVSANIHPDTAASTITSLDLEVQNFQLGFIDNFMEDTLGFQGVVNGDVKVEDLMDEPLVIVEGEVDSFGVYNTHFGLLRMNSDWDNDAQNLGLTVSLLNNDKTLLALTGNYNPYDDDNPLDFNLSTNDLPLELARIFYDEYLYDVEGRVNIRQLSVKGSLRNLLLEGAVELDHIAFGVRELGQKFYLNDKISIDNDYIYFRKVKFWDRVPSAKQEGSAKGAHYVTIDGRILHAGFTQFAFDLTILQPDQPELFVIDNTSKADETPFYGKVQLKSAYARITGPYDEIKIESDIDIADGSTVNIPISSYNEDQRLDFVYFGSPEDTAISEELNKALATSGIDIDLNVSVGAGTEARIIFDEKAGDVISAFGDGQISVSIAPNGEIQMFGNYEIVRGDYLFTFQNVINKKFNIDPGSRISWDGDPYDAQLDVTAIYERSVQLSSLDSTMQGVQPIEIQLNMTGSFLGPPQISFQIDDAGQSSGNYRLETKLATINSDEQELNRQVFSILLFGSFAPMGSFISGNSAQGVGSSVSEFLSNQLNNLLSKTLRSDDIKIDVQNQQEAVQVGLRINLFDDRVTIERNGALASGANSDLTIGNVQVKVQILPTRKNELRRQNTGVLEFIIFNRENISTNQVVSYRRGAGVTYSKRFNTVAEFFRFSSKKATQEGDGQDRMPTPGSNSVPQSTEPETYRTPLRRPRIAATPSQRNPKPRLSLSSQTVCPRPNRPMPPSPRTTPCPPKKKGRSKYCQLLRCWVSICRM